MPDDKTRATEPVPSEPRLPQTSDRAAGALGGSLEHLGQALDVATKATPALALLGLALYAVVRNGYDAFYNALGIDPEEAGVTQATILSEGAIGLVAVGLFWLLFGAPLLGYFPRLTKRGAAVLRRGGLLAFFQVGVLAVVVVAMLFGAYVVMSWAGRTDSLLDVLLLLALMFSVVIVVSLFRTSRQGDQPAYVAVLSFVVAALLLIEAAGDYGAARARVLRGGEGQRAGIIAPFGLYRFPEYVAPSLFRFRADPVCASWIGPTDKSDKPQSLVLTRPLLYLGRSDGQIVLYGVRPQGASGSWTSGPIRLPAGKLVIQPTGAIVASSSCPA